MVITLSLRQTKAYFSRIWRWTSYWTSRLKTEN